MTVRPSPTLGLLFALAGFGTFSIGDAVVKGMAGAWPGTAVATLRYTFGAIGLAAIILVRRGPSGFRCPLPRVQAARGACVAFATICVFGAVQLMPLADATAVQFVAPMFTAWLSALFLHERAPRAAWVASALAFAGVLVILRPNVLALGWPALLPIGNALGMAGLMIFNRRAANAAPALEMQFLVAVFAVPVLLVVATALHLTGIVPVPVPSAGVVARCAVVACTATFAHALVYMATERASAALIAPMMYVQVLVAGGIGWAAFGSAPTLATLAGAVLIVSGGLWLWRSQRPRRTVPETGTE